MTVQTSPMSAIIPPIWNGNPNVIPINNNNGPLMHVMNATQQPHAILASVSILSSLGLPRGGGGTFGVSISANNNPHRMMEVIRYIC